MDSQMDVLVSVLALLTWFAALSFYADILTAAPSAPLELAGGDDRAQTARFIFLTRRTHRPSLARVQSLQGRILTYDLHAMGASHG